MFYSFSTVNFLPHTFMQNVAFWDSRIRKIFLIMLDPISGSGTVGKCVPYLSPELAALLPSWRMRSPSAESRGSPPGKQTTPCDKLLPCILSFGVFEATFTKDIKKLQIRRNGGFSFYICLMIEGSGVGSGWPKNIQLRIRIPSTGTEDHAENRTEDLPCGTHAGYTS